MVVAGGGVAALAAASHLVELEAVRTPEERAGDPLEIVLVAPLVPHPDSEGSGLGGKAMSRSFAGRYDEKHHHMDRVAFYGPMMPHAGTVPHGYHVLWGYPNLRRLLRAEGEGDDLGGMLRPPPTDTVPGGAGAIASFQGLLDDPAPGGPGIGLVGLVVPEAPDSALRPATRALLELRGTWWAWPFLRAFEWLFDGATGIDPFTFADLFYAHEVDVEMRLALIFASVECRRLDPERATVRDGDGVERPLTDVEYDRWARQMVVGPAERLGLVREPSPDDPLPLDLTRLVPQPLVDLLGRERLRKVLDAAREELAQLTALGSIGETWWESLPLGRVLELLPDGVEGRLRRMIFVYLETERVLRDVPRALWRLSTGQYPIWRTLHFRFAPDATFASPRSFDAAQAARSLAFCFIDPRSSRMWTADGAKIQRLWLRLWRRLEAAAEATGVRLTVVEGRVDEVGLAEDGRVALRWGAFLGHAGGVPLWSGPYAAGAPAHTGPTDLGMPYQSSLDARPPRTGGPEERCDAFIPAMGPAHLHGLCGALPEARAALAPLGEPGNETLEIILWLKEPVAWSEAARKGLQAASITGLEGPFCLLADYRCGLWSEAALAAERPFGPDAPFAGSILESCGGMLDLFACPTRDDGFGWPAEVKEAVAGLLFQPAHVGERLARPWVFDDKDGWAARVADGTWTPARMEDPAGWEDWIVASRWLAWGWLRQLAAIRSLGPRANRQLAWYAALLDPRRTARAEILSPPDELRGEIRYVVMRNANRRTRFFNPGVGDWAKRPVSGLPLPGTDRIFPAGDWTRNGLDVVCMEGAALSGMRAARGVFGRLVGRAPPAGAPEVIPVLPPAAWYDGLDPLVRGAGNGPQVGDPAALQAWLAARAGG